MCAVWMVIALKSTHTHWIWRMYYLQYISKLKTIGSWATERERERVKRTISKSKTRIMDWRKSAQRCNSLFSKKYVYKVLCAETRILVYIFFINTAVRSLVWFLCLSLDALKPNQNQNLKTPSHHFSFSFSHSLFWFKTTPKFKFPFGSLIFILKQR